MQTIVRVTDNADRAELADAITILKFKHDRMPKHWEDRRLEVMDEIDLLVDRWLAAPS